MSHNFFWLDQDSQEKQTCGDVENDEAVSTDIPVRDGASQPSSGMSVNDQRDTKSAGAFEPGDGSYESRAAARKAAREKRKAQKQ